MSSNKTIAESHTYKADFQYKHNNKYHEKLSEFSDFVMRDDEGENYPGQWNSLIFKNEFPLVAEIGTGYGKFMESYCLAHPAINFIGLDYRFKRSYNTALKLSKIAHRNFRYLRAKGERLEFLFAKEELQDLFFFFPDPWPKARHHKKRLFQKPFMDAAYSRLKKGGRLWVKTDHTGYFEWMLEEIKNNPIFEIELQSFDLRREHPEHFLSTFTTKFEDIFIKQNLKIKAVVLLKK